MGSRGEGWVVAQGILLAAILCAPRIALFPFSMGLSILGWGMIAIGVVVMLMSCLQLGTNLTPLPKPVADGHLVTMGIYAIVRHPIYASLILAALGWGIATANIVALMLAGVLFVFFDFKSRREEAWLMQAYPEYAEYQQRVKKLIPWVY
jgi:protein-S-isoprenylcysteine O-methyltransferase Ste14